MAYKVLDPNGIGISTETGVIIIPVNGTIDEKFITQGLITEPCIAKLIKKGRLQGSGSVAKEGKVIAPDNRIMPALKTKSKKKGAKK